MSMHLMNSWIVALVRGVPRSFTKVFLLTKGLKQRNARLISPSRPTHAPRFDLLEYQHAYYRNSSHTIFLLHLYILYSIPEMYSKYKRQCSCTLMCCRSQTCSKGQITKNLALWVVVPCPVAFTFASIFHTRSLTTLNRSMRRDPSPFPEFLLQSHVMYAYNSSLRIGLPVMFLRLTVVNHFNSLRKRLCTR